MPKIIRNFIAIFTEILVPEEKRLKRLLSLNQSKLRNILPKSREIDERDIFPIFNYRNESVRLLIWAMKYRKHPEAIRRASEFAYEEIIELAREKISFEGKSKIALIPIPMSRLGYRKRGWNQTEELAREIARMSNGDIIALNILEKTRETEHQTKLKKSERLKNMKSSMRVRNVEVLKDTLPIIIDDVYTTGATIREAQRALQERIGKAKVFAITLAH